MHLSTAQWLLGYIYINWGRQEDAGCCLAQALNIVNSSCVTFVTLASTETFQYFLFLGFSLGSFLALQALAEWQAVVGRKEEAEKNQLRALEVMERVIGDHDRNARANGCVIMVKLIGFSVDAPYLHWYTAIYRSGRCWVSLGRHQEAEECLRKAMDLLQGVPEDHYVFLNGKA